MVWCILNSTVEAWALVCYDSAPCSSSPGSMQLPPSSSPSLPSQPGSAASHTCVVWEGASPNTLCSSWDAFPSSFNHAHDIQHSLRAFGCFPPGEQVFVHDREVTWPLIKRSECCVCQRDAGWHIWYFYSVLCLVSFYPCVYKRRGTHGFDRCAW